jgi:hypothetical protein
VFFVLEWFYFPFFKDWEQRLVGLRIQRMIYYQPRSWNVRGYELEY